MLRNDVGEPLGAVLPVGEEAFRESGAGLLGMLLDKTVHQFIRFGVERLKQQRAIGGGRRIDLLHVEIEHVHVATGETCAEVTAGGAKDDDRAAGHVFAAVVAHALHHEGGAAVTYAEAFAGASGHEHLSGCRTEAGDVACDHVLMRVE